jgi:HAD superfamily hydrolase (TIGR01484 family)
MGSAKLRDPRRHQINAGERGELRYFCVASDYDGTFARDGPLQPTTVETLKRVHASGRKLVLTTGRTIDSLLRAFPEMKIFDLVATENGALLYNPTTDERRALDRATWHTKIRRETNYQHGYERRN